MISCISKMKEKIMQILKESQAVQALIDTHLLQITIAAQIIIDALKKGNKVMACGNGGSALEAQHFIGELVGKFEKESKKPLPAIALTTDVGNITAIGNDYSFDLIFKRQIQALAKKGDVLICFSTSGNSQNIIKAVKDIKQIKTIALLGKGGGKMKGMCNVQIIINSQNTARIQESHLLILHILAKLIEDTFTL